MKRTLLLIGLAIVCLAANGQTQGQQAAAQEVAVASLNEALTYAFAHNPDYAVYQQQQAVAGLEYKTARAYRLPTISGSFAGQKNTSLATTPLPGEIFGQPGETINAQFGQEYTYNAGIMVSKQLFNWQGALNAKLAKSNIELSESETATYQQTLKQQVALYYYTALLAKQALATDQQHVAIADSLLTVTTQQFEAGLTDAQALNMAKINRNSVQQGLYSNTLLLAQCQQQLGDLFGLGPGTTLVFDETLTTELNAFTTEPTMNADARLSLYDLQVKQGGIQVKLQQAAMVPTLTLNSYFGVQQFQDEFGLDFGNDAWSNYSYLSLTLSVPLFNGFANRNRLKTARLQQDVANRQFTLEQNKAAQADALLMQQYQLSLATAQATATNYQLYAENYQLAQQQYEEGLTALAAYLDSFNDYLQARQSWLSALSTFYSYHATVLSRQ